MIRLLMTRHPESRRPPGDGRCRRGEPYFAKGMVVSPRRRGTNHVLADPEASPGHAGNGHRRTSTGIACRIDRSRTGERAFLAHDQMFRAAGRRGVRTPLGSRSTRRTASSTLAEAGGRLSGQRQVQHFSEPRAESARRIGSCSSLAQPAEARHPPAAGRSRHPPTSPGVIG